MNDLYCEYDKTIQRLRQGTVRFATGIYHSVRGTYCYLLRDFGPNPNEAFDEAIKRLDDLK